MTTRKQPSTYADSEKACSDKYGRGLLDTIRTPPPPPPEHKNRHAVINITSTYKRVMGGCGKQHGVLPQNTVSQSSSVSLTASRVQHTTRTPPYKIQNTVHEVQF
jgi:hypothetical protein